MRVLAAGAGVALISLLAVAAWLDPDPRQFGTHQQLGLPPCTVVELFGIRCPSCGMTTSWAQMMDGRPIRSVQSNAGGALLAIVSLVSGPWLVVSAARGRWIGGGVNEWLVVGVALSITVVTLIDWLIRLWAI